MSRVLLELMLSESLILSKINLIDMKLNTFFNTIIDKIFLKKIIKRKCV